MSSIQAKKILRISAFILGMFLDSAFGATGASIHVSGNYQTIQAGICDTVLVAPGTYAGCIALHVKSNEV